MNTIRSINQFSWSSPSYEQGRQDSQCGVDTERASFIALLRMPVMDHTLRMADFFAFDDYLKGYYEGALDKLRLENRNLREQLNANLSPKAGYRAFKGGAGTNSKPARVSARKHKSSK